MPRPGPLSLALLAVLLGALPWLAARTHRSGRVLALRRSEIYASACLTHGLLLVLLALVLWAEGQAVSSLGFAVRLEPLETAVWAAAVVAAGLVVGLLALAARRRLGRAETEAVRHIVPRTGRERLLFALLVAPTAGIAEEILYRGFVLTRVMALLDSGPWPAAAIASFAFALGHVYQGGLGTLRAALLGLLLTWPIVATGSLLPAIAAHIALDLLGGLVLGRWLLEEPATHADGMEVG